MGAAAAGAMGGLTGAGDRCSAARMKSDFRRRRRSPTPPIGAGMVFKVDWRSRSFFFFSAFLEPALAVGDGDPGEFGDRDDLPRGRCPGSVG